MKITGQKIQRLPLPVGPQHNAKTNTTIFLLPALSLCREELEQYGFVNAYLGDHQHDLTYKQAIYILLQPEKLDSGFHQFVNRQYAHPLFLDDYDVARGQVMLVYRFPTRYLKEYSFFIKGKYSRFSKKYVQNYFPMTTEELREGKVVTLTTIFAGIFNREPWLRRHWEERLGLDPALRLLPDEYWSVPMDQEEIFRYGKSSKTRQDDFTSRF